MDDNNNLMLLVSSCDEAYFPLLKGLYLSILESNALTDNISLAFIDIGCSPQSLLRLAKHNISVHRLEDSVLGALGEKCYGYHRAQICRPFLPKLFPYAQILSWIDCDTWFQDASFLKALRSEVLLHPNHILVSPEIHYTYTRVNDLVRERRRELYDHYFALYGSEAAEYLHVFPAVNSGCFAMHSAAKLWGEWENEILTIYGHGFESHSSTIRHFGEQFSLNKLIKAGANARYFDPLFNYLCLWNPPFRDNSGRVCVAYPPYPPVGMLHLAGGWQNFGKSYYEKGLLYRSGDYLKSDELTTLLELAETPVYR